MHTCGYYTQEFDFDPSMFLQSLPSQITVDTNDHYLYNVSNHEGYNTALKDVMNIEI
jgi:hypothetical protein